jgi:ABC-type nitrate/sulfonate/bicarbonate transport system permease component
VANVIERSAPPGRDGASAAEAALRPRRFANSRGLWATLTFVVIISAWEICGRSNIVDPAFSSYPSQIARALGNYLSTQQGWQDLAATSEEFGVGLALSIGVGIPIGLIMGYFRRIDAALDPLLNFLNASPRIALAPLFVLWFGIGLESKVAIVVFSAIIPIIVSARTGVATIDRDLLAMAKSWNASTLYTIRTVVLPGSVPSMAAGIRIGVGSALHGVVLAEFIAANVGVGFRINQSSNTFDTSLMFAGVILISALGVLVTELAGLAEKHFSRWRVS